MGLDPPSQAEEVFVAGSKKVKEPETLVPLTPAVFHILLALADDERHGLAITREVESRTGGKVWLGPGTLYPALKRMSGDGLIEESGRRPAPDLDDRRRRYYRLTGFGKRVLLADAALKEEELRQVHGKT